MQHFGKSIGIALIKKGASKSSFAEAIGVDKSVISKGLNSPDGSRMYKHAILDYFGMSESKFLELSE